MDEKHQNIRITQLILARSKEQPLQVAIYFGKRSWTYKALWDDVEEKASELKSLGVETGMGVGVIGQNSYEFITTLLAVMHIGGVILPISHNLKQHEIQKIIDRTKLHFIWSESRSNIPEDYLLHSVQTDVQWTWISLPQGENNIVVPHVEHAAFIRFTSGTTGKSKGVVLSHQSIIERTQSANAALQLGQNDVVIWVLSMAYHFVVSILLYLRYGCSICICEQFLADEIIDRTNALKGTFLYASPMHIRMLIREPSGQKMPTLKRVISTSMAITPDICRTFQTKFSLPITQAFGIIEVGLPVINLKAAESEPGAIGHPLEAYDVTILDESGQKVQGEEVGQLAVRGPGMFDAYLDPPMLREEAMEHGYFLTGDLAFEAEDGTLTIVGRSKNVINVAGNKAFPEEVEAVINRHPDVASSRVKGFRHPLLNECVMAEVVLQNGRNPEVEEIISHCRKRLVTYKVPQKIVFVDDLPRTDSGKIRRTSS